MDKFQLDYYKKIFYDLFDKKNHRNKIKQLVIDSGLYAFYKKHVLALYSQYCANNYNKTFNENLSEYLNLDVFDCVPDEYFYECKRLFNAERARVGRLKKRITYMLNYNCIFLTFTFTDSVLNTYNHSTLRTYVIRTLKTFSNYYVCNVDFGKKKGRIHYHALIVADKVDYSVWTYGALNGKKVIKKNSVALAKYIAKLTNHAIKETTKGSRIIYSRFKF